LKEEAQDHPLWKTRFEVSCGPILKQATERMGETVGQNGFPYYTCGCPVLLDE